MYKINGFFGSVQELLAILPFYFNSENSDITVSMHIDGEIYVTCQFGTGKGWDTLAEKIEEETLFSLEYGAYSMGYC